MTDIVTEHIEGSHIAVITLQRPEAMNAMSYALLERMQQVIRDIKANNSIRAVIITGSGEKAFCAGADLKERKGMTDEQVIKAVKFIGETINQLETIRVPVIAAINGVAFGGGLELALACDIRVCASHVKMGLTETSLAIIPGAGGTQRLPRTIGIGQAKKMIFTGKAIDASQALQYGLVEEVVETGGLMNTALSIAGGIAENGPIAVRQAKAAINRGIEVDLHTALNIEHECYLQTIQTDDRLEGLQAFSEKRQPIYNGK